MVTEDKQDPCWYTGERGVKAAFQLTWDRLPHNAQRLGLMLEIMAAAPIPLDLLEMTYTIATNFLHFKKMEETGSNIPADFNWLDLQDPQDLQRARRKLVEFHLIDRLDNTTYELHPLIQRFFREQLSEWDPEVEVESIKVGFSRGILQLTSSIQQTMTREQIGQVEGRILHLVEIAEGIEAWRPYLSDDDLKWPFIRLASIYDSQGLYVQAASWCQKCLEVVEHYLGSEHPDVATSLNNLGILYLNQQQYSQAQSYLEQALAILQDKLGSNHPYTQSATQSLQQAMVMQAFEAQRPQLEALLEQDPNFKAQLTDALRQHLDRDPSPEEILMALIAQRMNQQQAEE